MSEAVHFEDLGQHGRAEVIRVHGRLDARTSPLLIERCATVRDAGGCLVLNMKDVSFLSSSGIGAVLALTEEFREHGGRLCIAEASPTVREAIDLLNLDEFLNLFENEADALKELAA